MAFFTRRQKTALEMCYKKRAQKALYIRVFALYKM